MKAVDAALGLPWIAPCASSLAALAKDGSAAWPALRLDPGAMLLLARGTNADPAAPLAARLDDPFLLRVALAQLGQPAGWVDWSQPAHAPIYRRALRQAALAQALAQALQECDPDHAWIGGLLAPLGHMALCAAPLATDLPPPAIARRLARAWRLPAWLGAIVGHLGLSVGVAQRLGAEPRLFQIVQLAAALAQRDENGPQTPGSCDPGPLQAGLGLSADALDRIKQHARQTFQALTAAPHVWQSPARHPFLAELLELAAQTRRTSDHDLVEHLQRDVDQLEAALEDHQSCERERLQALKLSALAELAAGAGHEINNPLAVISGQAQYALRQLQQTELELVEDAAALAILHEMRGKVERSLGAIVGQAQRIHHVLIDLMQFARPSVPRRQRVPLRDLLRDAVQALHGVAETRKVRLVHSEPPENWLVDVDPAQMRTALSGLLRNALEAAPPEGWAGIRAEARGSDVGIVVEDNGQGLSPLALEHMFDPFFSGRSAGRGRGLGLSTAWRLARQHGGDVRYEGLDEGLTRFVMILPDLELAKPAAVAGGNGHYEASLNGVH